MIRLLLVGAGHAHLEVLRRFGRERPAGVELAVVTLDRLHYYSGMLPGHLNGTYDAQDITVDVPALVEWAGGRLHLGRALRLDRGRRILVLEDGAPLGYDLVSFNLGSGLAGTELPGVREHALLIKPYRRVPEIRRSLMARDGSAPDAVVGGGAAGVEIACSLAARSGMHPVRLVEGSQEILAGYGVRFRRRARSVLARQGVEIVTGARVVAVEQGCLLLEDDTRLAAHSPIWLAGASAPPIFRASDLATDTRGFLSIDDTLRHVADETIFAVGDCATLLPYPDTPKAGVYSVRQGPVLWESLMASIRGRRPPHYRPQQGFLSLLNTGDGRALLRYKTWVGHSRGAWWLKDFIDRRFMRRYRP